MTASGPGDVPWALLEGVTRDGKPVARLYDQWEPGLAVRISGEALGLILRDRDSGRETVWYLDETRAVRGCHIEALEGMSLDTAMGPIAASLAELAVHSLAGTPRPPPLFLPEAATCLASQIAAAWSVRHFAGMTLRSVAEARSSDGLAASGPALDTSAVRRLLETRPGAAARVLLSPFDDTPLRAQITIAVEGFSVHRFHAEAQDAAFYLAWPERETAQPSGLAPVFFCPAARLVIADHPDAVMLPGRLLGWYLTHPAHVRSIAEAASFDAREYGLGHASALASPPSPVEAGLSAEANGPSPMQSRSAAWDFLHETGLAAPVPDSAMPSPSRLGPTGVMGRLRGIFKRRHD
ncbi:hypothetical protein [Acidomonas methanolica]|uniref:Uncharacterized protein n=1 Tax=Acidomonas methanolica NBRC 104435 TaxID=1231351 RepID=A0A023D4K7_ACIMT|nr:hypothetical protein [Acidomonas methanolica]MBU2653945.1 hypothetical protein [Acidomonas methanolica]TCS30906.1 hypothetical protein EDC31_104101 [Acidomonas methanolica]GAJ28685.1 hypothetical protein Amme_035_014 [Acidomonas methanolica NBRC 104435]GBQ52178.1 hypothetical protein AA0498_1663 [Acidomonas methanolica]GEK98297.1 hypothetical protein AME01nite_07960 [Acidomonas methanolica NBRC 104435]